MINNISHALFGAHSHTIEAREKAQTNKSNQTKSLLACKMKTIANEVRWARSVCTGDTWSSWKRCFIFRPYKISKMWFKSIEPCAALFWSLLLITLRPAAAWRKRIRKVDNAKFFFGNCSSVWPPKTGGMILYEWLNYHLGTEINLFFHCSHKNFKNYSVLFGS